MAIDQKAVVALLIMYGLMPRADRSQFTEDTNRNTSLEVLYTTCGLLF